MQCTAPKPVHTRSITEACRRFPGQRDHVREVRIWARETLSTWGVGVPEDLALVITELATNAVDHTFSGDEGGIFTVRLYLHGDHVRVVVRDAGPRAGRTPTRRTPVPTALHGRGLTLVAACSTSWGALRYGTGVFAEVPR
ncbi:ATP-binding protein [Nocardiopsis sp. NPDC007018]|uniref:ATP-binding protein n=1 Tax=Nocardiopsis sp. NPDC007018 TaxID=3155721 RepID=UPI0033D3C902